jgi:hypothetical protein
MGMSPYKTNYSSQKSLYIKIAIIFVCVLAITIFILVSLSSPSHSKLERLYIGKVVEIEGAVNDIGLVEDFKEGKSILIISINNSGQGPNYHQLSGKYSIKILANSIEEYKRKNDQAINSLSRKAEEQENKSASSVDETDYSDLKKDFQNIESGTIPSSQQIESNEPIINEPSKTQPAVKNEEAPPSLYDKEKQAALKDCETMIANAAKKADGIDIKWGNYKAGCLNKSTTGFSYGGGSGEGTISDKYGRKWFNIAMDISISSTNYIDNSTLPQCRILIDDIGKLFKEIRAIMDEVSDFARKSSIYPGIIRELREKYRMEWSGWEM